MIELLVTENLLALRLFGSLLAAFGLSLLLGGKLIQRLSRWQPQQPVREYVPSRHLHKNGTPTLGGCLILTTYTISMLLWVPLNNIPVWSSHE